MSNTELKFSGEENTAKKDKEAKPSKADGFFKKIKGIKNIEIYIAILAVVVMLVIYFSSRNSAADPDQSSPVSSAQNYCEKMETELTDALSKLKDAGKAKVVINWESSVESIIAYITNNGTNSSTSTPQIININGSSQPLILKEIYPKALGVIIFCEGGDKVSVKLDIINAVSVLLDITPDKIRVYAMSKSK